MIHVDMDLARRLESLISSDLLRLCELAPLVVADNRIECLNAADGLAIWLGQESPVNAATGLGMSQSIAAGDLKPIENFYAERGTWAMLSLCPYADRSLLGSLAVRGWRVVGFQNLFILELTGEASSGPARAIEPDPEVDGLFEVRVCMPEEREVWAQVAALNFSSGDYIERSHLDYARIMAEREEVVLVLAWMDGEPVGTGSLVIEDGVGWMSADSTLPNFRRRGVQQAIQRHRLELMQEAGCELAVTEAIPGTISQRNMERLGFQMAYSHVQYAKAHGLRRRFVP